MAADHRHTVGVRSGDKEESVSIERLSGQPYKLSQCLVLTILRCLLCKRQQSSTRTRRRGRKAKAEKRVGLNM